MPSGRKPGPPHSTVVIRIPLTLLEEIDAVAVIENSNRSKVVRRAIDAELERVGRLEPSIS